ncbi:MAG: hypothetical protein ACKVE4_01250 [Dissulfuribacterales bacterium]
MAHKVERVEAFGRDLRTDDTLEELGKSSYDVLRDLIKEGKNEEALKFVDYVQHEFKWLHDLYCDWTWADLDYVSKTYGEEEVEKMLRYAREVLMKTAYKGQGEVTPIDNIRLFAEGMRAHRCGPGESGNIKIWEEEDRYVMEFDPCGSGGRQRRTGELDGLPPRNGEPFNLGCTKKAYSWSWGRENVPYYCLHCSVWHEIMMIERLGYPAKITDYNEDPNVPCRWYFYKDPKDIPEEYYTRVGMKKPEELKK